jgi:hypothetical protein
MRGFSGNGSLLGALEPALLVCAAGCAGETTGDEQWSASAEASTTPPPRLLDMNDVSVLIAFDRSATDDGAVAFGRKLEDGALPAGLTLRDPPPQDGLPEYATYLRENRAGAAGLRSSKGRRGTRRCAGRSGESLDATGPRLGARGMQSWKVLPASRSSGAAACGVEHGQARETNDMTWTWRSAMISQGRER